MKHTYISPLILDANGTITLSGSQLEKLGIGDEVIKAWEAFWDEVKDEFNEFVPGFDPDDVEYNLKTYGFDLNDEDTWMNPLLPDTWPQP